MWLQACLNGSRTSDDHPAVPMIPDELAEDARRVVAAGAASIHVHIIDRAGKETPSPDAVGEILTAIRDAVPGLEVGISTAEYIEPDLSRRLAWIEAWTILPDFVAVNLSERGIAQVISVLVKRNVGLEAGIWSAADAQYLMTLREVPWYRL